MLDALKGPALTVDCGIRLEESTGPVGCEGAVTPTSQRRTNEQWLSELRAQDHRAADAHGDLVEMLRRGLVKALRPRGVDEASIEDFVQEAAIRVLGSLDMFRGQARFSTWAITIAVRVAFTQMRRRRWKEMTLSDLHVTHDLGTFDSSAAMVDPGGDPEMRARICEIMRQVIEQELPERQRRLVLAELADMPMDQLAAELGLTRNAVYKAAHDARKRLKSALGRHGVTDEQVCEAFGLRAQQAAATESQR